MATIRTRKHSDGTVRYTAVVRIRKGNRIIHQEYKTFAHRSAAVSWAKHRELELENPGKLLQKQHSAITLAWRDNDSNAKIGLARDAKHPTNKDGNHRRFKYTPEDWRLRSSLDMSRVIRSTIGIEPAGLEL